MPTYEYVCRSCEHQFEEFQSITAAPLASCPKCDGALERLIGAGTGLIFKGSGFYITDYKDSKKGSTAEAKDSTNNSNGSTDSSTKTEAKKDSKTKKADTSSKNE